MVQNLLMALMDKELLSFENWWMRFQFLPFCAERTWSLLWAVVKYATNKAFPNHKKETRRFLYFGQIVKDTPVSWHPS
jgi:hypothetical protein